MIKGTSDRATLEAIGQITGTFLDDKVALIVATVNSVDMETRTCDCTAISSNAATDVPGVLLQAEQNDGFFIVPSVGSTVIISTSTRNEHFVFMWSDIDAIHIITADGGTFQVAVGSSELSMIDGTTQFNAGSLGGLINIVPLVAKINALENLLNDLITQYNAHKHTGVQTGTGTSAITTNLETGKINPITQRSDIEDTTVIH